MKYTIVQSLTARGNWQVIDSNKSWDEAWRIFSDLKARNTNITYHIF